MTQPVCAYEGCGHTQGHPWHRLADRFTANTLDNHRFQPQSTVESTPVNQHRPGCPRYSGVGECDCFDDIPASEPHVHNFDANGICVTMGCTPAIHAAAASVEERLTEIAERYTKAIESERQWHAGWPVPLSLADIPYLLRLVAELRQKRDEAHRSATLKIIAKLKTWVGRVGHEDYYKSQAKLLELESRAEQAERERDAVEKSHSKTK